VRAVENGIVAYSGNELRGFGNLLLIRHAGGWTSAYAHNQVLLVRAGDRVRRGQVISKVGKSGSVRRPQLHFELRRGKHAVNPARYMSRRRMGRSVG
jgi:murein DD-endopeptidase MepM/ murein hydrolase activator NlpD